jgi:uncharacterized protein YjbI with pentapeptide repeats
MVTGADFGSTTSYGFTKEHLYSTASYQSKNLRGIGLGGNDLRGWDFRGQDLSYATFHSSYGEYNPGADLANADLSGANLTHTQRFGLYNVNFTGTNLTAADIRGAYPKAYLPDLSGAVLRNTIMPDGKIAGLDLSSGEELVVRNFHGGPGEEAVLIPVKISHHLTIANGGVLQLLFDADAWDSTISFQPDIPVALGGTLELVLSTDVNLTDQVGRTFDVFDWSGVDPTGQFQVASPYTWDLTNLYTTGDITLTAVPEPSAILLGACGLIALVIVRRYSAS